MRTSIIYQKFTLLCIAKNGHLTCLLGPTVFEQELCPIHGEMNSLYCAKMTKELALLVKYIKLVTSRFSISVKSMEVRDNAL